MNARVELTGDDTTLRQALHAVLETPLFARAPRTCNLLAFLVDQTIAGRAHAITERAIGLAVFRRDARSYDTALDPVVRVQMGRLRARLAQYDAEQPGPGTRLTIPPGSYVPVFIQSEAGAVPRVQRPLQLVPLRNLTGAHATQAFVAGVDEELGGQLFAAFGSLVQLPQQGLTRSNGSGPARHRLEGSIRIEQRHVRASMRLVDIHGGDTAWLAQIDCHGELDMALQAQLASAICVQLQQFLAAG